MNKTSKGLNRYEIHLTDKLMSEIEAIAISDGAKIHHISKKPVIRDTVISLLELGIKAVYEGVDLPKKFNDTNTDNDNRIDLTVLDSRIEEKLKPLYNLISELSDKLNRINDTDNNSYSDIDTDTVTEYELIGVENIESNLVDNLLSSIQKDNTENITLSECDNLPLKEVEGQNIPNEENKPENEDNYENVELLVGLLDEKEDKPKKPKKLTNYDKAVKYIQGMAKGETVESKAELTKKIGIKSGSFFTDKTKAPKNVELWDNNFEIVTIDGKEVFAKK